MFDNITIIFLFSISLIATILYFISYNKSNRLKDLASMFYWAITLGTIGISAYFLIIIMNHDFQYAYVYSYSNTELSQLMLMSTFYAGQEGSILLWTLMLALTGFIVMPYAKKYNYESVVMGLYSLIMAFLFMLLIVKSPFERIWDAFSAENLPVGFTPENGRGLNPVLENYWMAIHPPILFAGYSLLSIPFTFAIAGLVRKEFHNWINIAAPWTLFSTALFGLGISLGSFWAYESLSFGGFWAWDPVENASFLPWLVAVSLVHTMKVQKATKGLIKTNFILAFFTFVLVLYATFLTRSGVLSDSSVHSFAEAGETVHYILLLFLLVFLFMGFVILITRIKDIPKVKVNFNATSREFYLSLGTLVVLAIAVITLIGTSAPIIPSFLFGQIKAATPEFYNEWTLPLAILIMLINSFSVYLTWRKSEMKPFFSKITVQLLVSIGLSVLIIILAGINDFKMIVLLFSALFSLVLNIWLLIKKIKIKPSGIGAYVGHLGLAFFMLGTLSLALNARKEVVVLNEKETKKVLGYDITWIGKEQVQIEKRDRQKFEYVINVAKDGATWTLRPIFLYSAFNNFEAPFPEPGINNSLISDLYIVPVNLGTKLNLPTVTASKMVDYPLPIDSSYIIRYKAFKMPDQSGNDPHGGMLIGAIIELAKGDSVRVDTVYASFDPNSNGLMAMWKDLGIGGYKIAFYNLVVDRENMSNSQVEFAFSKDENAEITGTEQLVIEFNIKPFMSLVWLGFILMIAGFIIPIKKPVIHENKTILQDNEN